MQKLVLLPGMDGTGELFRYFLAALPEEFEALTVRYPTHHCSSQSELLDIVRAACPASEPFVLLAESFSTPLGIQCAATSPANLQALILCAGFATSPVRGWRRFLSSLFMPIVFRLGLPEFAIKQWLTGTDVPDSLLADVRSTLSSVQSKVLASRVRSVFGCDVRPELGQIAVPILYIQAKRDRLVSPSCLEDIRRIKPQLAVVAIEGPHLLLQREPQRAADTVAGFVQRLE